MFVGDIEKEIWIFVMVEPFTFLSVENGNVRCLICNQELQKKFNNYHWKVGKILLQHQKYGLLLNQSVMSIPI